MFGIMSIVVANITLWYREVEIRIKVEYIMSPMIVSSVVVVVDIV